MWVNVLEMRKLNDKKNTVPVGQKKMSRRVLFKLLL